MRRRQRRIEEADRAAAQLAANTAITAELAGTVRSQGATLLALRRQGDTIARQTQELHDKLCPKKKNPSSKGRSPAASRSSRKRVSESVERRP